MKVPANKTPQKELLLRDVGILFDEVNRWRNKSAQQEKEIEEKNITIKGLEKKLRVAKMEDIKGLLTETVALGFLIKKMRVEAGLSLDKMARKLFVSKVTVHNIENGKAKEETIIEVYERVRIMKQRGELNK